MVEISRGPGVTGWNPDSNLPQGVVSPSEHRMGISALALYEGVFMDSADSARVSTSTSSRDLSIAPARVAIKAPLGGYYTPSWQSPVTLTPAVAGSQARIDTIAVRQSDYELDPAATTSLAELILVQGTASATPSPPSLGDGVLGLADVRIPAGSTTSSQYTITRRAQWTTPVGGSPHFDTEAARNAALPKPVAGQECTTGSGASLAQWQWDGTAWVEQGLTAAFRGAPLWGRVGRKLVALSGQIVNTTNPNGELRIIHNGNLVGVMSAQFSTGDTNAYRGYIVPATGTNWSGANDIWAQTTAYSAAVRCNYLIMGWVD